MAEKSRGLIRYNTEVPKIESDEFESKGNVTVVCRFRPLNQKEKDMNDKMCIEFGPDLKTVSMKSSYEGMTPLSFNFDRVFDSDSLQKDVYEVAAKPIVESVLEGFNGTVLTYGQTSSGKTHTMTGPSIDDPQLKGIIPRMVSTVFQKIEEAEGHLEFTVKVAYCEIYLEKIRDLLDPNKKDLKISEDKARGIYIVDLTEEYVSNDLEVYHFMKVGHKNREVGATNMNEGSSRSHAIFMLSVIQTNTRDLSSKSGKLYLVDLAGSEKVGKTGAEGKRLDEAKNINKSLSTLGLVIFSLTDGKSTHVPYRDSKLTRVLQDSIGGNSKTCLIITCSPASYNEPETLSTLRFGVRAKAIKNKPKVNKEYSIAELKLLLNQANEQILKKDARIVWLESHFLELGGVLPSNIESEETKEENRIHNQEYQDTLASIEIEKEKALSEANETILKKDARIAWLEKHCVELGLAMVTNKEDKEENLMNDQDCQQVAELLNNEKQKILKQTNERIVWLEKHLVELGVEIPANKAVEDNPKENSSNYSKDYQEILALFSQKQKELKLAHQNLRKKDAKIAWLENHCIQLGGTVPSTEELDEANKENSTIFEEYQEILELLEIERQKVTRETESSAKLKDELKVLNEKYENLKKENYNNSMQLVTTINELVEKLDESQSSSQNLRSKNEDQKRQIGGLGENIKNLEKKIEDYITQISKISNEYVPVEEKENLLKEIESLRKRYSLQEDILKASYNKVLDITKEEIKGKLKQQFNENNPNFEEMAQFLELEREN